LSLLSIIQNVAKEAGFSAPGSVIGNTDDTAVMLLALVNRAGKMLARRPWARLQSEYTFNLVNAQAAYAFPADLGMFLDYTFWNRTQYWSMRGSLSPQQWQAYKSGVNSTTPRQRFRVKAGSIYIDPTPSTTDSCVIEYCSKYWVAATATPTVGSKTEFSVDTDVSILDEVAIEMDTLWRFLNRKGLAYAEEKDQAERYIEDAFGSETPCSPMSFSGDDLTPWPPLPTLPVTGYS
jgi:hypothetical protein